jgi:predicted nucleic acid-binding protein
VAAKSVDFDGQRRLIAERREEIRVELERLAEKRRGLLLDGSDDEVRRVEAKMVELTADADRARDSLTEIDKREAAHDAAVAAAERRRREAELAALLKRHGVLGGKLADLVAAAVPLVAELEQVEHEILGLAAGCEKEFTAGQRKLPQFSRLAIGRLDLKAPSFYVSPTELPGIEAKLRSVVELPLSWEARRRQPAQPARPIPAGRDPEPRPQVAPVRPDWNGAGQGAESAVAF